MIKRIEDYNEVKEIIDYIGEDLKKIPYLYVNVKKYGLGTDNILTWIDRNEHNDICGVYMRYYDCIHFFTKDTSTYSVHVLYDFINSQKHRVIMLQEEIGDRLDSYLDSYYSERNYVIDMDSVGLEDIQYKSELAKRTDICEIVDLLMADPEYYNVYDKKVLLDQMLDRYDSNFSRYFIIRMDNIIVATCSTYGEVDNLALMGGVIVHPKYRRMGLARDVENFGCHILEKNKISRVGFVNYHNTASLALHQKLGAYTIATLAKFIKK